MYNPKLLLHPAKPTLGHHNIIINRRHIHHKFHILFIHNPTKLQIKCLNFHCVIAHQIGVILCQFFDEIGELFKDAHCEVGVLSAV